MDIPEKVLTPIEDEPEAPTLEGTEGEPTPIETPPAVEEPKPAEVDYKKKFSESSREVQRLLEEDKLNKARLAETEAKLEQASAIPSEDDLSRKYPDWELLTDAEKAIYRRVETQERDLVELKEERAWQKDFSKAKSRFPQLAEREQEFKDYCYKYPRSVDALTLAKSFLFDEAKTEPQRKGLESPTAGPKELGGSEFTWDDVDRMRVSDPKLYEKLIREGRIDTRKIKK